MKYIENQRFLEQIKNEKGVVSFIYHLETRSWQVIFCHPGPISTYSNYSFCEEDGLEAIIDFLNEKSVLFHHQADTIEIKDEINNPIGFIRLKGENESIIPIENMLDNFFYFLILKLSESSATVDFELQSYPYSGSSLGIYGSSWFQIKEPGITNESYFIQLERVHQFIKRYLEKDEVYTQVLEGNIGFQIDNLRFSNRALDTKTKEMLLQKTVLKRKIK